METDIPDNTLLGGWWRVGTLNLWTEALTRYQIIIAPKATKENTRVKDELEKVHKMKRGIAGWIREGQGDYDHVDIRMHASSYKWLSDIFFKYWKALEQELVEKKRFQSIEGEFEGEEKKVEEFREMLQKPPFSNITRTKILVDSLRQTTNEPVNAPQQIQYNIGQMIGQNVINSTGITMNQTNNLLRTMQQLSEEIEKSDLEDSQKSLATAQIQTIQTQFLGPQPDKGIIQKAFETLNRITLLIQVPETLDKVKNYLQAALTLAKLFHPQAVDTIHLNAA